MNKETHVALQMFLLRSFMPRQFRFTKDEIIDASITIVREKGFKAISAREIGKALKSSSKPIFSLFENMEEVNNEIIKRAYTIYTQYIENAMKENKWPKYKASGMAYISFAKEEKELFKLLFMRDRTNEEVEKLNFSPFTEILEKQLGITKEEAELFHLEMWICVHGIASMIATSFLDLDEETISNILSDNFLGLKNRFLEKKNESNKVC